MITDFELVGLNPYYRIKIGEAGTISNSQMTNDLAIKFLKVAPSRIKLFSRYPDNWEELLGQGKHKVSREELEAKKYNELAKEYPDHFKIGMKKKELIDKILG